MKIPTVKHMRDFFPEEMRRRLWIEDTWRTVSERAGFAPWDAPILETLELYRRKSGDEIVSQLYSLTTKGGDELAIRPEMTPSLARMIAERQNALPRPVKWYTIGRMCRYERGQRGRLREFWQWNVDMLGVAGPIADAEVISVALDGLEALGLTSADVEVRLNSRALLAGLLAAIGIPEDRHAAVYAVTDKRGKVPADTLRAMYGELGLKSDAYRALEALMETQSLEEMASFARSRSLETVEPALKDLEDLFGYLAALGKGAYARCDIGVVRGLAYYTGPVFEIFDKGATLRALCGGGRYDRLMETMGGQSMPACGFGMGDVVLGELLKELGKAPADTVTLDVMVIPLSDQDLPTALAVASRLRAAGKRTDYAVKAGSLGKAMKRASELKVREIALVGGQESASGAVKFRDMATGEERLEPLSSL